MLVHVDGVLGLKTFTSAIPLTRRVKLSYLGMQLQSTRWNPIEPKEVSRCQSLGFCVLTMTPEF